MDWCKRKKSGALVKKQRLVRGRERGEILLEELIECCDGKSNPIKFFSADDILKATDNLSECTCVSKLFGHGKWYSGMLDSHRTILVKKLWRGHPDYPRDFYRGARDIAISSMVSGHKNFMKLVGCCLEFRFPVIVYYDAKKQYCRLDLQLMLLSWNKRMKIAEEIATALAYLHTAFSRPLIYRNMYIQNILLGEDEKRKFPNWLSKSIGEGRIDEIVDLKMLEKMGEVSEEERCRMKAFLFLSERCIGLRGEVPKMVQVVKELRNSSSGL
ncbi:hypothetical protein HID58_062178 [Brassica napus]|uniref:BnaC04g36600D protein n=2 Tax=Brassica napus TaxID=3708 RepID=A0A078G4F0_BRANA|nr:hypothetical protein HID58_062178 [Brassica napus]CDY20296.1 BnaC04g36600D [Brassica napus]